MGKGEKEGLCASNFGFGGKLKFESEEKEEKGRKVKVKVSGVRPGTKIQ